MKINVKTCLVSLLLALSVSTAFARQDQEGKTPPKKGDKPVVEVKDKKDREEQERQKQEEERKRREQERKKPQ